MSGSGGRHLFYSYPQGVDQVKNTASPADWKGLDIKGDRGYIILHPSYNESGQYKWLKEPKDGKFPPLPKALYRISEQGSTLTSPEPLGDFRPFTGRLPWSIDQQRLEKILTSGETDQSVMDQQICMSVLGGNPNLEDWELQPFGS